MFKHLFEVLEKVELQKCPALTCLFGSSAYDEEKMPEVLTSIWYVLCLGTLVCSVIFTFSFLIGTLFKLQRDPQDK